MLEPQGLLVTLVIGLIAGWLAGQIMKGSGYGLVGDLVIGIIGAFIGSWLWHFFNLPSLGNIWINNIVSATVGALVLLLILRLIKR